MFCATNHLIEREDRSLDASSSIPNSIRVTKLYLLHLSEDNDKGILIESVKKRSKTKNKIPLKLKHSDNFGLLQFSYRGSGFHYYFPLDSTVKIKEILLKKSRTIHENLHDSDWDIIHIKTKKKNDCNYLFEKAIEDNYIVILAIQFEIIDTNNLSRQLTLYPHGDNGTPLHRAVAEKDIKTIEALLKCNLDINERNKACWTPLLVAVDLEMSDVVDHLISNGADVNGQDDLDQTPLHYAAKRNNSKIIDTLIKNRAKIDEKNEIGQTPLHYAVDAGNVSAVDILLKNGADYKLTDRRDRTPFHLIAESLNLNIIEIFLKNNIGVDNLNSHVQTLLFYLSKRSHLFPCDFVYKETYLKIINTLIKYGANINFQDSEGKTPLHYAVIINNFECIQALLECNADISILTKSDQNILHLACWHQANQCILTLLNVNIDIDAVDVENRTALQVAVERKHCRFVELILRKNANINVCDNRGKTVLHLAVELESLPVIELLLRNGANIDLGDGSGNTALHLAIKSAHDRITELLLKNNADVNLTNASGETALLLALKTAVVNENIIMSILNSTNDINATDILGRTAIHHAALYHKFNILKHLLENNGNINARDSEEKTPLHLTMDLKDNWFQCVKVLVDYKADVNAIDKDLISPLHLACFTKKAEVVKYLLENRADSNIKDKDGRTVFHYACMDKLNGMPLYMHDMMKHIEETLNVLVEENISVNCVDIFGKTPLHYAAEYFLLSKIYELLFNVGADINIEDKNHNLALDESIKLSYFSTYTRPYIEHIVKMKVMKLWVQERLFDKTYKVNNKGDLKWILLYEIACSREIDSMKSTNLDQCKITYYDFLEKSPHDIMNYTRNHNVVNAIQSDGLITKFPIYGHFLKCHLREAQRRNNLYEQIHESLTLYVFKKLPTLCVYEILRYLDNSEFNLLLNAMKPVVLIK